MLQTARSDLNLNLTVRGLGFSVLGALNPLTSDTSLAGSRLTSLAEPFGQGKGLLGKLGFKIRVQGLQGLRCKIQDKGLRLKMLLQALQGLGLFARVCVCVWVCCVCVCVCVCFVCVWISAQTKW